MTATDFQITAAETDLKNRVADIQIQTIQGTNGDIPTKKDFRQSGAAARHFAATTRHGDATTAQIALANTPINRRNAATSHAK